MEAALAQMLPSIAIGTSWQLHPFQGKGDLLKKLPDRLRAYARWLPEDYAIVVMLDSDRSDPSVLEEEVAAVAASAGFEVDPTAPGRRAVVRLAVQELEAWFFGDWPAVQSAYPRVAADVPRRSAYRDPDAIDHTWESLERLLQAAGYFAGGLRKVECATEVSSRMDPHSNRSSSFGRFRSTIEQLIA